MTHHGMNHICTVGLHIGEVEMKQGLKDVQNGSAGMVCAGVVESEERLAGVAIASGYLQVFRQLFA